MQPEILMCSRPRSVREIEIAEAPRQFLRDRDRARIGEAAIVEARARDDVGDEADIRRRDADRVERAPQRRQVALRHMRQHEVLLVADADFAERIALGEIGDRVHLLGGGVAGRPALGLERQRHDRIARQLVLGDRIVDPGREALDRPCAPAASSRGLSLEPLVVGIAEARRDVGDDRRIERQRAVLDRLPLGLDFLGECFGAELVHQDLDARLVDVVAPAELVVDAQHRLDVAQQIALGQERLDGLGDERRAAKPAADHHLEADFAGAVAVQPQPDVVHLDRGAVVRRGAVTAILNLRGRNENSGCSVECWRRISRPDARVLDLVAARRRPTGRS